jgi:hypothetical protein
VQITPETFKIGLETVRRIVRIPSREREVLAHMIEEPVGVVLRVLDVRLEPIGATTEEVRGLRNGVLIVTNEVKLALCHFLFL